MSVLGPVIECIRSSEKSVVTPKEVACLISCPELVVTRAFNLLEQRGFLTEIFGSGGKFSVLRIPKQQSQKPRKIMGRDKMWRIIRAKKRFTRIDVARLTGSPLSSVEDYFKMLIGHGYIRKIGRCGQADVFMLIKNPGPCRPILSKKFGQENHAK